MTPEQQAQLDIALRQQISRTFVAYAEGFGLDGLVEAHRSFERNVDQVMDYFANQIGGELMQPSLAERRLTKPVSLRVASQPWPDHNCASSGCHTSTDGGA